MAAVSHLKNKKEAKQREGLEKVSGISINKRRGPSVCVCVGEI